MCPDITVHTISLRSASIRYADYTEHYTIDAGDMPMPEDMGHFRRSLEQRRFRLIAGLLPSRGIRRVLDAGCGSGWLSEMLARRGFSTTALDLGFDSLRRASMRLKGKGLPLPCVLGDVFRLPFGDASFDAAVASEILEHLDDPAAALTEIARVVRPGGTVVISTPYRERIEYTLCIHCNRKTPVNAHLHSFDERSMSEMLETAGCKVDTNIAFVSRVAERMGMAGLTHFLPYAAWRMLDIGACSLLGRQSFMAVRAVRNPRQS